MNHEEQKLEDDIKSLRALKEKEHGDIFLALSAINKHLAEQDKKLEPIYTVFSNVDGAFNVAKWIMIGLGIIGAGIGGMYALIYEIKAFFRVH